MSILYTGVIQTDDLKHETLKLRKVSKWQNPLQEYWMLFAPNTSRHICAASRLAVLAWLTFQQIKKALISNSYFLKAMGLDH